MLCLIQAGITLIGPLDSQDGSRWAMTIGLLARFLPGIVLVIVGLGMLGLGAFEIVAPEAFDKMGRGLLEAIYGIK
jgi:hypothetical protein